MSLSSLIEKLKVNGYQVDYYTETNYDFYSLSVYRAKKGKLFSKKMNRKESHGEYEVKQIISPC